MIGLLYKDILYIKNIKITKINIGVGIIIFMNLIKNNFFTIVILLAVSAATCFSMIPFQCDNYSKWNEYQYAFPINKEMTVCSRYLFGAIIFGICTSFAVLGMILNGVITKQIPEREYLLLYTAIICFIPVMQSILFPLLYCFDIEKGKLYAVGVFVMVWLSILESRRVLSNALTENSTIAILVIITIFVILCYVFSMCLSIHIEKKKCFDDIDNEIIRREKQ